MIFVGTDIVLIPRIAKNIEEQSRRFLNHVFTEKEQTICEAKASPDIHYSGKFAAKEAVKKAILSSKKVDKCILKQIEILNDDSGAPFVSLQNEDLNIGTYQISVSHSGDYATATAVLILP
ncbi:MAG: holo-ACP synthase [Candidatus Marinimicrobia bacterium]|nr:holo-ACP synthase [Candidatus Neomarinimicrobiota bacterium]